LEIALIYCGKGRSWSEKELSYFNIFENLLLLDLDENIKDKWMDNVLNTLEKLDKKMKSYKKVFVSLPYSPFSTIFDSEKRLLPLGNIHSTINTKLNKMKDFIDRIERAFNYKNLQFFGIYWYHETY
jgi:hypothetical protein